MPDILTAIAAFLIPFLAVFIVQPSVAKVALAKNFIAEPEDKLPGIPLLSLGGVSMFIGINLSIALLCRQNEFVEMHDLIAALIVMLFSGFLMDTNMAFRYFRFAVKLLAAILVVVSFRTDTAKFFPQLPDWIDIIIQLAFMVIFMLLFHRLTIRRKNLFLLLAFANALVFSFIYFENSTTNHLSILAASLAGSLGGIIAYSRYAVHQKKPLPLIGHTGIYLTALIIASLWLHFIR